MNRARLAELGSVLDHLGEVLDDLEPVAAGYAVLVAERRRAGRPVVRDDLATVRPAIAAVLAEQRGWIAGAGLVVAPGRLQGTERWLEWWWTRPSGAPEALRVNLDETAADFFDYTSAEWYAAPAASGRRHAAGPYVDYLCTNQYAVTLTAPVLVDDVLIGVVGADVLVSSLETRLVPLLLAVGGDAALVTDRGRVIASAAPQWAPGHRVRVQDCETHPLPGRRRRRLGGADDWLLVRS